jgi:hypothetical protein
MGGYTCQRTRVPHLFPVVLHSAVAVGLLLQHDARTTIHLIITTARSLHFTRFTHTNQHGFTFPHLSSRISFASLIWGERSSVTNHA